MTLTPIVYWIVCPLVFLAGFVDSLAGGGGLISLPAYLLAGLPPHYALGTNKAAMSVGTFTATVKYLRSGHVDLRAALLSGGTSFLGSLVGSSLSLMIPESALKLLMLILLPFIALFLFLHKDFGSTPPPEERLSPRRATLTALGIGLVIGCYDGLIGPGTGTFLLLSFTALLGFDLLKSSGCAKLANLASNLAALLIFVVNGKVLFALAVPAAVFAALGNYLGARLAISGGSRYVRYTVFLVIGLLFVKISTEFI